jgi:2-polyprenyl-3-methyl-5-hydroxy-6-metoxy-1,4-benzoquinol methylase
MNPYRDAFYKQQANWHRYESHDHVRDLHETRARYYEWYTRRGWLPEDRSGRILDVGCGSGQFLYFLRKQGYQQLKGIDVDREQIKIGQALGLDVEAASVFEYLQASPGDYEMIVMLDCIEHFTREELFPLFEMLTGRLRAGGRLLASVPNAESPDGLRCVYADITHEIAFTPMSFEEMLFCHGLKLVSLRDPWPAPLGAKRRVYRWMVQGARAVESVRMRLLGFEPPRIWSNVMWGLAVKERTGLGAGPSA